MTKLITRRSALRLGASLAALPLATTLASADGHGANHTVEIRDFAFSPKGLALKAGDSVTFVNMDSAPHTATDVKGAFDTGTLQQGEEKTLKFASAGTVSYFCAIHPMMKATLTISG